MIRRSLMERQAERVAYVAYVAHALRVTSAAIAGSSMGSDSSILRRISAMFDPDRMKPNDAEPECRR